MVLVPFLLSTAVFTRLSVLDLTLPAQTSGVEQLKVDDLKLEIVIRPDALEVGDRIGGLIQRIARHRPGHDVKALAALMQQIKATFPDTKTRPRVLAEPDTSYDVLVQVMDAVRAGRAPAQRRQGGARRAVPRHLDRRRAGRVSRAGQGIDEAHAAAEARRARGAQPDRRST